MRTPARASTAAAFRARRLLLLPALLLALAGCGDVVVAGDDGGGGGNDTGGDGGTPVTCPQYCDEVIGACGVTGPTAQYVSRNACLLYCETWAGLPQGTTTDTTGNTVGCRLYHATVAEQTDPGVHCVHAGPSGGNECGTWCDNYCHLALRNCTGDLSFYDSRAECLQTCATFPTNGGPTDEDGNSVQCRIHYLGLAGAEPPATAVRHCPNGGPDGGDRCVH